MIVKELLKLMNTDEYIIINDNTEEYEIVRCYEKGSHKALKKYFDNTVKKITPCVNSIEIRIA